MKMLAQHAMRCTLAKTMFALLATLALPALLQAAPNASWTTQATRADCSGSAMQAAPACYSYASDLYENINYTVIQPGTGDIQNVNVGYDSDYFYVEMDFVSAWAVGVSTGHQVVIEFDTDSASEANRGDYFVGIFQKNEFNSTTWIDAHVSGGYETYQDANNDVGGANPLTSNFGGSAGNGYNSTIAAAADSVWARIVGGNFQIAVRRSVIGSPTGARLRPWSRQSTSLSKDKLYFHDQNAVSDVSQIDNLSGLGTDQWIGVGPAFGPPSLLVAKVSAAFSDPASGTTNPKSIPGGISQYTVTVTNQGTGSPDGNSLVFVDPVPIDTDLCVNDIGGAGSGPLAFADGAPSSTLIYTFSGLGSGADSVAFSNDGGVTFAYTPVPDAGGCDSAVTHLRVMPGGTFAPSNGVTHPSFQLRFRVRIQ